MEQPDEFTRAPGEVPGQVSMPSMTPSPSSSQASPTHPACACMATRTRRGQTVSQAQQEDLMQANRTYAQKLLCLGAALLCLACNAKGGSVSIGGGRSSGTAGSGGGRADSAGGGRSSIIPNFDASFATD